MCHFNHLHALLLCLGLSINDHRLSPPCKALTCLGCTSTYLKLLSALIMKNEWLFIRNISMYLTKNICQRKIFNLPLGKLIYLHKCVVPAGIFINRMLELFRSNSHKAKMHLSKKNFKDLEWLQKFLPHFNGTTIYTKPIADSDALHLDACLMGMDAIWHNRVYSAPVPAVPGLDLTIVHLEMLNIIVALILWGPLWQVSQVKILCDNEAASGPGGCYQQDQGSIFGSLHT